MKVLFIGGTGLISTAVTELAIERGLDLTLLNRGQRSLAFSNKVQQLYCDIYDEKAVQEKIKNLHFDVVVQWIAFTVEHVERDYRLFKGHTNQYVFISSASAYQKPIPKLPITEHEVALGNPFWEYSQNKEKCEVFLQSIQDEFFPVTIIRPSHTYNLQSVVSQLNSWSYPYTLISRLKLNKPVIMPDEGKALWTLTYNKDFANAFLDVLGNPKAYNEFYHLTSEKSYTWLELFQMLKKATNSQSELVFIPIEQIAEKFPDYYGSLLGDMRESTLFDNSKIKKIAPHYVSKTGYEDVVQDVVSWYENHPDQQNIDKDFDKRYDALILARKHM
jgi:nucleoside-diphosphate-sugar epimerase